LRQPRDYLVEVGVTGAEAARQKVAAPLGDTFAVREYLELAGLSRLLHRFHMQLLSN